MLTPDQKQLLENWEKKLKKLPNYYYKLDYYKTTQPKDMIILEPKKFIKMVKELLNLQEAKTREEEREYIAELEKVVTWLAHVYQSNFEHLHQEPLRIISIANPNRREMTPEEEYGLMNFATVQGLKSRIEVEKLSKFWKSQPINIEMIIKKQEAQQQILSTQNNENEN